MARVASSWIEAKDRRHDKLQLVKDDKEVIHEPWGEVVIRETDANGIEVRKFEINAHGNAPRASL